MQDLLKSYCDRIDFEAIAGLRAKRLGALQRPHWQELSQLLAELAKSLGAKEFVSDFASAAVSVGQSADLSAEQHEKLKRAVELLIPWRKGPFSLFGLEIDSEWRSNLKWDRVHPVLGNLAGKKLADVGCGNGYYMFRALSLNPECVIGFDPSESFYFAFNLVQSFIRDKRLSYELLGAEHVSLFPNFFDVVLCMGVLYHHRDPLKLLHSMREGIKPGGKIIVESICIPGKEPVSLTPEGRYAGMKNVYFVPTIPALVNWLKKTGFEGVEVCSDIEMTVDEQRSTKFAPFRSYGDVVDREDRTKTVEGYPVPRRVIVSANSR